MTLSAGSQIRPDSDSGRQSWSGHPGIGFRAIVRIWTAPIAEEAHLELSDINIGLASGIGLIVVGLTVLLVGLLWSATRRLRNLADDPAGLRRLIIAGLGLAAAGVVLAALTVNAG
ncbi:MAG: hypothetical protein ACRDGQ_04240 [Candidatus Limnocylindrales bacterium]